MLAIRRNLSRSLRPRQLARSVVLASIIPSISHFAPISIRSLSTCIPALRATAVDLPFAKMTEHYPAAPQAPPAWNYTPESIKSAVQRSIHDSTALLDHIASLQPQDCTFASVVQRLAIHEGQEANLELPIFLQYVSTDKEIRDEAVNGDKALQVSLLSSQPVPTSNSLPYDFPKSVADSAESLSFLQDYGLTALTRIDVYQALLHAQKNTDLASLSPDDRRLMDRMILDRTRNGLGLSPDKRESLLAIKKQIMEKAVDFSRNCNEEKGFLLFTAEVRSLYRD